MASEDESETAIIKRIADLARVRSEYDYTIKDEKKYISCWLFDGVKVLHRSGGSFHESEVAKFFMYYINTYNFTTQELKRRIMAKAVKKEKISELCIRLAELMEAKPPTISMDKNGNSSVRIGYDFLDSNNCLRADPPRHIIKERAIVAHYKQIVKAVLAGKKYRDREIEHLTRELATLRVKKAIEKVHE